MDQLIRVAALDEIREHCGTLVRVNGEDVTIFKLDGKLFAISNVCAHQHFSMLHKGEIIGSSVTCPMHGWSYDIRTGKATSGDGMVATYIVKTKGNDVFIEIPTQ